MATVRVLILRAPGINCDEETAFAWQTVGAKADRIHVNRLCEHPRLLDDYQVITLPGGFSYGDDIASGRILANQLSRTLADEIRRFIDRGGLIAGICNGFQVIVRMGLVPGADAGVAVTLTRNASGRYEDRWVRVLAETDRCPFLERGATYHLPVAHGEGRIVVQQGQTGAALLYERGRIALRYVATGNDPVGFPANPNGSIENIAGLIDSTGRVFGLMPHPERCMFACHPPVGTRVSNPENEGSAEPDGLRMFRSAARFLG